MMYELFECEFLRFESELFENFKSGSNISLYY